MIKANELMVGNLIYFEGETCKVLSIDGHGVDVLFLGSGEEVWIDLFQFTPIPLTEEWLLKLGFSDSFTEFKINNFVIAKDNDLFYYQFENYQVEIPDVKLQYVHQLQNLYFALTGEELELKVNALQ